MMKLTRLVMLVCVAVACNLQSLNAQTTLYKAGKVYTMTGQPLEPGQVLVADGKIKEVASSVNTQPDVQVVDLGPNSVLIPGLVNAYSQAGLSEQGSDEFSREITPDFATIYAIDWKSLALRQRLENGTTCICICPGTENVIGGIASVVKTAGDADRRVMNGDGPLVTSLCGDPSNRNRARQRPDSIYVRQPTNRMGVVWLMRTNFNKSLHSPAGSPLQIVKQALDGDRTVYVVSRTAHDIHTVQTLADEFNFSPVLVKGHEAHKLVHSLADRNIPVVLDGLTTGSDRGPENAELNWNQAGILAKAGVAISLSGSDLLTQARFAHRFGLDQDAALASITKNPAKLLGIDKQVGTIAPGLDADMVALSGEPLELTSTIRWVLVDGKTFDLQKEE